MSENGAEAKEQAPALFQDGLNIGETVETERQKHQRLTKLF